MSDVLLAGDVAFLGEGVLDALAQEHRLVVAHTQSQSSLACVTDARVRAYAVADDPEALAHLFDIYSFATVVYVSGFVDGGVGLPDEQDLLQAVAGSARQAGVEKLVYLTGLVPAPEQPDVPVSSRADDADTGGFSAEALLRARQQEELAGCLLQGSEARFVVVRVPVLACADAGRGVLARLYERLAAGGALELPFCAEAPLDLLSQADLGSLLRSLVEEPDVAGSFEAGSGYARTWGALAGILCSLPVAGPSSAGAVSSASPAPARVTCADDLRATPAPAVVSYPVALRRACGWIPFDDAFNQLPDLYACYLRGHEEQARPSLGERARALLARAGFLKYAELLVLFALVQLVDSAMGTNIYYRFVDVRLLFVVLMGTMHGMRFGVLAALLACASMLASHAAQGTSALTILMRVEMWLHFALYFLAGAICGYVTDRKDADVAFARQEYRLLHDKYRFLNEVYTSALENKRRYKRQILGFEDSFGRIFSVVQRLDDVMPQKLYLKALEALEDVLRNRSVALYALDGRGHFGRLMACSRPLHARLAKSADLAAWPDLTAEVARGGVWRNVGLEHGAPALACGSFYDGRLQMLVCVWRAEPDQLDMRFANLLKVMCGLLEVSFRRADGYASLARGEQCVPGTDVLCAEPFAEVLKTQREMGEKGVADFVVLRFPGLTAQQAQERLVGVLRVTDEVGLAADDCVCALLRQARPEDLGPVSARLAAAGLAFEPVEG